MTTTGGEAGVPPEAPTATPCEAPGAGGQAVLIRAISGKEVNTQGGDLRENNTDKDNDKDGSEKAYQCVRCHDMVQEHEKVSIGRARTTHVCHSCNRSQKKARSLQESSPELVKSFLEMGQEDLVAFCKAHQELKAEALKSKITLRIDNHKKLIEEESRLRTRTPVCLSVLKSKGYTDAHLKSIMEVCDSEWNPEIQDRFIAIAH